ncbi:xanthine uracil vitamin C permease [Levilactobacillus paucivorans]|uniref:Xanthine uracil vitamin C permease n=1 Tax=Levilactobacillus paucivorans TaxID=616990 RepID=A0A0R2M1Z2_9LACO|nr:NCS2 family permease [Levilactobacillus paucivorans]KRO04787.1 xanthine uracil vitamin C permease [Levilactobacillus paucivorans]
MDRFFKLKESGTNVGTEIGAGITTFFAMSYILFVNPQILGQTGMPQQAVFLATIIASVAGTLVMGLFANVPYALAPGMGLNAFFTYTVVLGLGFSWQEALALVFFCGIINIIITATKIRKMLISAIPMNLQLAISGGIGAFIAYVGLKNANFLEFTSNAGNILSVNGKAFNATQETFKHGIGTVMTGGGITPALAIFNSPALVLALIGLVVTVILKVRKIPGALLIGILLTTIIGIPMGVTNLHLASDYSIGASVHQLGTTFLAAFSAQGMGSLFSEHNRIILVLMTILSFSLSDTFDSLGTFIGTGRQTGIFAGEKELALEQEPGFKSKLDKALFADSIATGVGSIFGTSNLTTYVESSAGIGAGGRTGLTSVVVAVLFALSALASPLLSIIPTAAIAPSLILVGIMMMSSFSQIPWHDLDEAIPAFMTSFIMAFAYNITYGIAAGFIFYCIVKTVAGKGREVHPLIWIVSALFVINFAVLAFV